MLQPLFYENYAQLVAESFGHCRTSRQETVVAMVWEVVSLDICQLAVPVLSSGKDQAVRPRDIFKGSHRVYLCGPINTWGCPDYNRSLFKRVEQLIKAEIDYVTIINPARQSPAVTWREAMTIDIIDLIGASHIIYLPHWYDSRGSQLENLVAVQFSITRLWIQEPFDMSSEHINLLANPHHETRFNGLNLRERLTCKLNIT